MCGELIKGILNHNKNKEDLTVFHSVACEQTLPGHSGSDRGKAEGELAVMSRELEFHIQCSLPSLTGLSVLASQHRAEMSVKCT